MALLWYQTLAEQGCGWGKGTGWAPSKPQGVSVPASILDLQQNFSALLRRYSYQNWLLIELILILIEFTLPQKGELHFLGSCSPCASLAAAEHRLGQPGLEWLCSSSAAGYVAHRERENVQRTPLLGPNS